MFKFVYWNGVLHFIWVTKGDYGFHPQAFRQAEHLFDVFLGRFSGAI